MRYLVLLICGLFVLGSVVLGTGCAKKEQAAEEQAPAATEEAATEEAAPEAMSDQAAMQKYDVPPEPIEQTAPMYPEAAKAAKVTGKALVTVMIDAAGMVTDAQINQSSGDSTLDAAAVEAARKWTFKPAMKEGAAVASEVVLPVEFKLE